MNKILRQIFITVFFVFFVNQAFAGPSAELEESLTQADGSVVSAVQKGDEWQNRMETTDGYTIEKASDGNWHYVTGFNGAKAELGDKVGAGTAPPSGVEKGLEPAGDARPSHAPGASMGSPLLEAPTGPFTGKVLFILAEFSDRAGSTSEASWANFITNNIADYFNTASYGNVTLQPATESYGTANNGVVGWVDLGYAHPNTGGSTGAANRLLTKNAIIAANPYINYASYDTNSDGYVDSDELAVVVIVAGYERSYSSSYTPNVWGHKWSVFSPTAPTVDGVIVGSYHSGAGGYAQFGELHRNPSVAQHQATMGIMVHELGHLIFALPDLYDTDGSSSGIGAFGIMASGSWGKKNSDAYAGATPILPSAWSLLNRGWVDGAEGSGVETLTAAGALSATSANTVYKASTGDANQYFLVQNRQNVGYDQGLERYLGTGFTGGLNIFHIDDSIGSNANDAHRKVDVEEADGTQMGASPGVNADLWYAGNATTFDDTTTPDSKLYNGTSTTVDINSISATGSTMTATFGSAGTAPPAATLISPMGAITDSTPTYTWNAVASATWYKIWVSDSVTGGIVQQWYTAAGAGCASGTGTCSVTPATALADGAGTWWILTYNSYGYGPWSAGKNFNLTATGGTTPAAATLVSPMGAITDSTPTYTWDAVSNASWYYIWVDDSATSGVVTGWHSAVSAGCGAGTGTCSITPPTTLADGAGTWWIRTWNSYGYGPWSAGKSFNLSSSVSCDFDSQFNGSAPGWTQDTGTWSIYSSTMWYTPGVDGINSTSTYTPSVGCGDLDITAKQWRNTANPDNKTHANSLLIRAGGSVDASGFHDDYYAFQWALNGNYSVWKRVGGVSTPIQGWTNAGGAINGSGWNELRVVAEGSNLTYYINGTMVWSGTDNDLSSGLVAVREYKGTYASPNIGFWNDYVTSASSPGPADSGAISSAQSLLNEASANEGSEGTSH